MKVWVRAAGVAVGVVLALSLWSNWQLYQQSMANYRELQLVRLDPLGLEVFEAAPAAEAQAAAQRAQRALVVLLGDSRAAEWTANSDGFAVADSAGLSEAAAGQAAQGGGAPVPGAEIFVLEDLPGYAFVNRGIGAQTTAQVLGRLEDDVLPLAADVVVIQVGINDLKTLPLFPKRAGEIIAQTQENIRAPVDALAAAGVQQVIVTTIFPIGAVPLEQQLVWTPRVVEGVAEVNAYIRTLARPGVVVVDTGPLLADDRGVLRAELRRDALHLNAEGYGAVNGEVRRVLREKENE
jgi:lysophospholipase L1-like esterase